MITYSTPLRAFMPKLNIKGMQVFQNRALRLIGGYDRYTRVDKMHKLELNYLYFPPSFHLTVGCFCPVGLSLLLQHFQQVLWMFKLLLSPGLGS